LIVAPVATGTEYTDLPSSRWTLIDRMPSAGDATARSTDSRRRRRCAGDLSASANASADDSAAASCSRSSASRFARRRSRSIAARSAFDQASNSALLSAPNLNTRDWPFSFESATSSSPYSAPSFISATWR
jgi:hypothetical protein